MGLDTLDENRPRDSDPVSLGDDAIRETRASIKQSFGVEHYLDGQHKIPIGTTAVRPAAAKAGRLYFNTTTQLLEFDTGTAWQPIRSVVQAEEVNFSGALDPNVDTVILSRSYGINVNIVFVATLTVFRDVTPHTETTNVDVYNPAAGGIGGVGWIRVSAAWPWAVPLTWSQNNVQDMEVQVNVSSTVLTPTFDGKLVGTIFVV
jgi:hypothetical protein